MGESDKQIEPSFICHPWNQVPTIDDKSTNNRRMSESVLCI